MFIVIYGPWDKKTYPINTEIERTTAADAIRDAGQNSAAVWHGEPTDADAYQCSTQRLFATCGPEGD